MQSTGRILAGAMSLAAAFYVLPASAIAAPLAIDSMPQETGGPFIHNVFHTASSSGGASGSIKAWINTKSDSELGPGESNFYDPITGDFELHVNIYNDSSLTELIGMGLAFDGDPIEASGFAAPDDGTLVGTIVWELMLVSSPLATHLGSLTPSFTINLANSHYVTSSAGFSANSYANGYLTGWGSDGILKSNGSGKYTGSTIGLDLVVHTIPEPSTLLLACFGCAGLTSCRFRRRSRCSRNR